MYESREQERAIMGSISNIHSGEDRPDENSSKAVVEEEATGYGIDREVRHDCEEGLEKRYRGDCKAVSKHSRCSCMLQALMSSGLHCRLG
jgi:hypothetical protein